MAVTSKKSRGTCIELRDLNNYICLQWGEFHWENYIILELSSAYNQIARKRIRRRLFKEFKGSRYAAVVDAAFFLDKIGIKRPLKRFRKDYRIEIRANLDPATCVKVIRTALRQYRIDIINVWIGNLVCNEDWKIFCFQSGVPTPIAHCSESPVPPMSIFLDAVSKWQQDKITITLWWFEITIHSSPFLWEKLAERSDDVHEWKYRIEESVYLLRQLYFTRTIDKRRLSIGYRSLFIENGYRPIMIIVHTFK